MAEEKRYSERELKLAQLASFVDGEGAIMVGRHRQRTGRLDYDLRLVVTNSSLKLMEWLTNEFYGTVKNKRNKKKPGWKETYEWVVYGRNAYKQLKQIEEFLIIKREHASVAMKFWYETQRYGSRGRGRPLWKITKQEEYYQRMKQLNKRGTET